jgi:ubiquinone biosynthesis protein UbiJ
MNATSASGPRWTHAARAAVLDRWTLLCNHVLRAEPRATERLAAHAGRVIRFEASPPSSVPSWLPTAKLGLGPVWWSVTKAGMLERLPDEDTGASVGGSPAADGAASQSRSQVDVTITLRAATPLQHARAFATGDAGVFEVQGDTAVVADVRWILDNVRWDVAGDVERMLPQPLQAPAASLAGVVAGGLRSGARAIDTWWPRPKDGSSSR